MGRPLYMQKLEPKILRAVECIRIVGPFKVQIGEFGLRHGRLGSVNVAWGKATIGGQDAMAVASMDESGETKLSVNFKGAASEQVRPNPLLHPTCYSGLRPFPQAGELKR